MHLHEERFVGLKIRHFDGFSGCFGGGLLVAIAHIPDDLAGLVSKTMLEPLLLLSGGDRSQGKIKASAARKLEMGTPASTL